MRQQSAGRWFQGRVPGVKFKGRCIGKWETSQNGEAVYPWLQFFPGFLTYLFVMERSPFFFYRNYLLYISDRASADATSTIGSPETKLTYDARIGRLGSG